MGPGPVKLMSRLTGPGKIEPLITISVEVGSTFTSADPPPDEVGASFASGRGGTRGPVSATTTGVWPPIGRPQGCGWVGRGTITWAATGWERGLATGWSRATGGR